MPQYKSPCYLELHIHPLPYLLKTIISAALSAMKHFYFVNSFLYFEWHFKGLLYNFYFCACVSLHVCMGMCTWVPDDSVGSPRPRVTGGCESPDTGSGNQGPLQKENTLNHISPAPYQCFHGNKHGGFRTPLPSTGSTKLPHNTVYRIFVSFYQKLMYKECIIDDKYNRILRKQ